MCRRRQGSHEDPSFRSISVDGLKRDGGRLRRSDAVPDEDRLPGPVFPSAMLQWSLASARRPRTRSVDVRDKGGDDPVVTLSDDVVTLRPWSRDEAGFIAEACADPAVRRYKAAVARVRTRSPTRRPRSTNSRRTGGRLRGLGTPSGVAFAIVDATSGELAGQCGVDDWSKADVAQFGYWLAPICERTRLRDSSGDPH